MTDRELLEAAAKASGLNYEHQHGGYYTTPEFLELVAWCPLTDDGDALRLAVKLGLLIDCDDVLQEVKAVLVMRSHDDNYVRMSEKYGTDQYTATRRAIVRAAAAIGGAA